MADATQKNIVFLVRCTAKNAHAIAGVWFPSISQLELYAFVVRAKSRLCRAFPLLGIASLEPNINIPAFSKVKNCIVGKYICRQ